MEKLLKRIIKWVNKKTADALRESETFNRSILSSITAHLAVVDAEGKIIAVNKAWDDFSIANEEVNLARTGKESNYFAVCKKAAAEGDAIAALALKGFEQVLKKEIPVFEMEYPCNSKHQKRWFLLRVVSFSGDSSKIVMVHTDISERKEAELKMQHILERYDILTKATSDTIWDWDIINNKMHYNDGVTRMLGYKKSTVENIPNWWDKNVHPDDGPRINQLTEEAFKEGRKNTEMEYRYLCANNTYKYILDRAFILYDEAGKPVRMIGAMQDITERKKLRQKIISEKILKQKELTEAVVAAQEDERSEIGGELHDNVCQLLATSQLSLGMLKKSLPATDLEWYNQCRNYIILASDEIRNISHRLSPVLLEDTTLQKSIEILLNTFNTGNKYSVTLYMNEPLKNYPVCREIHLNLYRIMQEQLRNIFKYAHASTIKAELLLQDNEIRMMLTDNGIGFDTNKKRDGIGVANMKRRAELFSGSFSIISAPGNGCKIIVSIPLKVTEPIKTF